MYPESLETNAWASNAAAPITDSEDLDAYMDSTDELDVNTMLGETLDTTMDDLEEPSGEPDI